MQVLGLGRNKNFKLFWGCPRPQRTTGSLPKEAASLVEVPNIHHGFWAVARQRENELSRQNAWRQFHGISTPRKMEMRAYIPSGNPEVAKRGRRIEILTWQREEDRKWPVLGQTRKMYSFWFGCSGARCMQPKTSKDCVSGSQWQWTRCSSFHDNRNHNDRPQIYHPHAMGFIVSLQKFMCWSPDPQCYGTWR